MKQPMRTPLEQSVLQHIRNAGMFAPGDRVGVAVSGGADSVALLRILEGIHMELGISLSVVHFDHQLRGAESDRDAEFVSALAGSLGLDFVLHREDVAAAAERHGWNIEEAARTLRYAFFQRVIDQSRATRIAVAHTADDQAETVVSHLIRGTGPAGLGGIYPVAGSAGGTIIRPLLSFRRSALRSYLEALGQTWCEDSSNADRRRMRARIRAQLLPVLERDFSPRIVEHLCELARLSREEEVFWSALIEESYRSLVQSNVQSRDQALSVSVVGLLDPLARACNARVTRQRNPDTQCEAISRPLTERLIRRLYEGVRGDCRGLGADHVEQVIRLAATSTSGRRIELPGDIVVERRFNDLFFSRRAGTASGQSDRETISTPNAYQYTVVLPSAGSASVSVPELGSRFHLKLIDWAEAQRETRRDNQTFDADSLRTPLILRNWRPGDAYTPHGRRQPRKLKEMLLAARVPVQERREWPVLESAGFVIWARGMPVAQAVRACKKTRVAVVIAEEKL
jgi:tRNA(Ile)-lysidine synthase